MAISKITTSGVATDTLTAADLAPNSVDSSELVDGSIDLSHMSVNSIDSDQYVDGSIDLAHMSVNSIDSDQYVDASIDTAHLASNIAISTSGAIAGTGGLTIDGATVFNEASADVDFRIESNDNANMFVVDGGVNKVGIGAVPADALLYVTGAAGTNKSAIQAINTSTDGTGIYTSVNHASSSYFGLRVDNSGGEIFRVNGNGRVGIGTATPSATFLDINGNGGNNWMMKITNTGTTANDEYGLLINSSNGTAYPLQINNQGGDLLMALRGNGKLGLGVAPGTDPANPYVYIKGKGAQYDNDSDGLKIQSGNANRRILNCADWYDSVQFYLESDGDSSPDISDKRFKRNITDLKDEFPDVLSTISNIVPKRFNMVKDLGDYNSEPKARFSYGVLAQDLESLLPDLAYFTGNKDGEDIMKIDGVRIEQPAYNYFFDKQSFTFLLLLAIKELSAKVAALE